MAFSFFYLEILFQEEKSFSTTEYIFSYNNKSLVEIRSSEKDARIKVLYEGFEFPSKFTDQDGNMMVIRYNEHHLIDQVQLVAHTDIISSVR